MDWSFVISMPTVLMGIVGAALVVAGAIAYRGSTGPRVRTLAAAAIAAGVALFALILWLTPVSVTSSATPGAMSPAGPPDSPGSRSVAPTAGQPADWKLYRNEDYGFEFRYPAACPVSQSDGSFDVGGRIELAIADSRGLALPDYVAQFMDERTKTSGWKLDSQQAVTLGANNGIRVDYRFGGTNRFGTAVFIERKGRVYAWGLTAGGFTCDEPAAFDGIASSFRFTMPGP